MNNVVRVRKRPSPVYPFQTHLHPPSNVPRPPDRPRGGRPYVRIPYPYGPTRALSVSFLKKKTRARHVDRSSHTPSTVTTSSYAVRVATWCHKYGVTADRVALSSPYTGMDERNVTKSPQPPVPSAERGRGVRRCRTVSREIRAHADDVTRLPRPRLHAETVRGGHGGPFPGVTGFTCLRPSHSSAQYAHCTVVVADRRLTSCSSYRGVFFFFFLT